MKESQNTALDTSRGTSSAVTDAPPSARRDDLDVAQFGADPYVGPCPAWCVMNRVEDGRHDFQCFEEDRQHGGEVVRVALRAVASEHSGDDYVLGHAEMYLMQPALRRDPHICANINGLAGIDVTLDEAEQIARALMALVEAAR